MRETTQYHDSVFYRRCRSLGSVLFIGLPGYGILLGCVSKGVSFILPLAIYLGYVLSIGFLLSVIAERLFRHHELRELKVDLAVMLLVTTLLALPLGISNALFIVVQSHSNEDFAQNSPEIRIYIAAFLYFLILPIFFATEAAWRLRSNSRS